MRRKWRERIEELEAQVEALHAAVVAAHPAVVDVRGDPVDVLAWWRTAVDDYSKFVDDEVEEGWRLTGYL